MLFYNEDLTFSRTVKVAVPVDGGFDEQSFKVVFKLVDDAKLISLDVSKPGSAIEFLNTAIVGLEDIVDADNVPLPFTDELRAMLIGRPFIRKPIITAYFDAIYQN